MADWGLKISQPGDNVLDTPPKDLVLSSEYPTPKVKVGEDPAHFGKGEYVVPSGSGSRNILTVPHGYDYVPTALVIVALGNDLYRIAPTIWFFGGPNIDAYCDDTNLKIDIVPNITNASGLTVKYKYYIFDRDGT